MIAYVLTNSSTVYVANLKRFKIRCSAGILYCEDLFGLLLL